VVRLAPPSQTSTGTVKSIEIDPGRQFPDVDRDNQRWPR
jgi:hypothetical protein